MQLAGQFWDAGCENGEKQRRCLGGGLLDLDDLAGTGATGLAGRGLGAAALRAEDGRGTNDGSYQRGTLERQK